MSAKQLAVDWQAIELAVASGMSLIDAAKAFDISYDTLRKRAYRHKWPTTKSILERAKQVSSRNGESRIVPKDDLQSLIAVNWLEKQEAHRALSFEMASKALKTAKPDALRAWNDIAIADKMARKASGLDTVESNGTVNVNLALVNQRIMTDDLPPDSVEQ